MTNTHSDIPEMVDVAIVGAGPYGLSIAAHLRALGVPFRIFGSPMNTWLTQMPAGMRLKSEGFASSLSDPDSVFPLREYCREQGLPYADTGSPVPLATFAAYGIEFQRRFVPSLEEEKVALVRRSSIGFEVQLENGEMFLARAVVVAAGISHFGYVPPVLASLPAKFMTHSSRHSLVDGFRGKEVAIIGAGASAVDLAALLCQAGASVQLIARSKAIRFHDPPTGKPRTILDKIQRPLTGIGSGWKLAFYANVPHLFQRLPKNIRLRAVKKTLGPAPGWFVKQEVVGKVPFHLGFDVTAANVSNGKVVLDLVSEDGTRKQLSADHVIAATGYKVDLGRLPFLGDSLRKTIQSVEQSPILSPHFESSISGLYFVGTAAANSFGPLMRFACGAEYTARRLSHHLAKLASKRPWRMKNATNLPTDQREEAVAR
jgi:cation diffusion facilitator CzcD-associated flavoprotein CzcO